MVFRMLGCGLMRQLGLQSVLSQCVVDAWTGAAMWSHEAEWSNEAGGSHDYGLMRQGGLIRQILVL